MDYEVVAGTQATFRCNAVTDESLDLTIEWLHKDQLIDFDTESRFIQTNDYSLTISKANELDSGIFTCRAKTELDQDTAQAMLTVQGIHSNMIILHIYSDESVTNFAYVYR
jgi:neuronal cell adhesion molecule